MESVHCKLKTYIQPFEKKLALKELEVLAGNNPVCVNHEKSGETFVVNSVSPAEKLAERLTYWEMIADTKTVQPFIIPKQSKLESTTNLIRNGINPKELKSLLPFNGEIPSENRRNLRYGPHGIHEYRGKFFPQLVRSLVNISNIDSKSIVLDPMCGSGTTNVESKLLGYNTLGVDLNPLSVLISQVKCDVLDLKPAIFITEHEKLKEDLLKLNSLKFSDCEWLNNLSVRDQDYLSKWFSKQVLKQIDPIIQRINKTRNPICKNFFRITFSNIIRKISWQKVDDLRVRKDVSTGQDIDVFSVFTTELNSSFKSVLSFLYELDNRKLGKAHIYEGDSRKIDKILTGLTGDVDLIITSPPYATALPYLDTDRLSLYYLNLLSRSKHRQKDYEMIGNREITKKIKTNLWLRYQNEKSSLTTDIQDTIDLIYNLNKGTDVGFRRKNLPPLLAKYFFDMKTVLTKCYRLVKTGSFAYFVVGNNHTIAGGQRINIETDKLLAELGEKVGFKIKEEIPMDMIASRDIFKKNAGSRETIITFQKT